MESNTKTTIIRDLYLETLNRTKSYMKAYGFNDVTVARKNAGRTG